MTTVPSRPGNRIYLFVDFANLELTMRDHAGPGFRFDWSVFPEWLVREAAGLVQLQSWSYEAVSVYVSYDPSNPNSGRFREWTRTTLNRMPGVHVIEKERRRRLRPPRCPHCHNDIQTCPTCGREPRGMQEKGIDTQIVTDMIKLAWEDAYDVAVLVSSDADFIPAVDFLHDRGRKVIQAGFRGTGNDLAAQCWASFDLFERREEFQRP